MNHHSETFVALLATVFATITSVAMALFQTAQEISEMAKSAAIEAQHIQILQELSEMAVLGWSFAGGCIGALIAWTFYISPSSGKDAARGVVGSIAFAFAFSPWVLRELQWPPSITNAIVVSVALGILAWPLMVRIFPQVLSRVVPVLVRLSPNWLLNALGVSLPPGEERNLHTPPTRRRRVMDPEPEDETPP